MENQSPNVLASMVAPPGVNVITAAVTLKPTDYVNFVTIPAAAANNYTIKLPPVGHPKARGKEYIFYGRRAASYVNGEVAVDDQGDSAISFSATDGMTANQDRLVIKNYGGLWWYTEIDVTT